MIFFFWAAALVLLSCWWKIHYDSQANQSRRGGTQVGGLTRYMGLNKSTLASVPCGDNCSTVLPCHSCVHFNCFPCPLPKQSLNSVKSQVRHVTKAHKIIIVSSELKVKAQLAWHSENPPSPFGMDKPFKSTEGRCSNWQWSESEAKGRRVVQLR